MTPSALANKFRRCAIGVLREHFDYAELLKLKNRRLIQLLSPFHGISPFESKAKTYGYYLDILPQAKEAAGHKNKTDFYGTKQWRNIRYKALVLHGGSCQCCGATAASTGKPLHVDHIKPRSKFPELEYDLDNLQVLCADCNFGKSSWDDTDWRANTNIVPFPNVMGL